MFVNAICYWTTLSSVKFPSQIAREVVQIAFFWNMKMTQYIWRVIYRKSCISFRCKGYNDRKKTFKFPLRHLFLNINQAVSKSWLSTLYSSKRGQHLDPRWPQITLCSRSCFLLTYSCFYIFELGRSMSTERS